MMKLQESMKRFKTKNLNEQPEQPEQAEKQVDNYGMDNMKARAMALAAKELKSNLDSPLHNPQIGLILDIMGSLPMLTKPATLTKILLGYSKAGLLEDELVRDLISMIPGGEFVKVGMVIKKLELINAKAKAEASAADRK